TSHYLSADDHPDNPGDDRYGNPPHQFNEPCSNIGLPKPVAAGQPAWLRLRNEPLFECGNDVWPEWLWRLWWRLRWLRWRLRRLGRRLRGWRGLLEPTEFVEHGRPVSNVPVEIRKRR